MKIQKQLIREIFVNRNISLSYSAVPNFLKVCWLKWNVIRGKMVSTNLQHQIFRKSNFMKCIYLCLQILPIMNYISNNKFVGKRLIIDNFAISLKTWSRFELIFSRIFVTFSNSFFNLIKRFFFFETLELIVLLTVSNLVLQKIKFTKKYFRGFFYVPFVCIRLI